MAARLAVVDVVAVVVVDMARQYEVVKKAPRTKILKREAFRKAIETTK